MADVQRRGRPLPPPPPRGGPLGPPLARIPPRPVPVDREKVGGHHNKNEFAVRGKEPKDEVQIYTWMDATLRELTDLLLSLTCMTNYLGDRVVGIFECRVFFHIHSLEQLQLTEDMTLDRKVWKTRITAEE
ncbi:Histone deacetylase complex subunit SAP18 [Capsicum annuum]|nr:Histone deacetylase complex subunit SAP18 [Capsicum annuum]